MVEMQVVFRIEKEYYLPFKERVKEKGYKSASEFFREKVREFLREQETTKEKERENK